MYPLESRDVLHEYQHNQPETVLERLTFRACVDRSYDAETDSSPTTDSASLDPTRQRRPKEERTETARGDIRCDEDRRPASLELAKNPVSFAPANWSHMASEQR
jgi:hypothetical protein